MKLNRKQIQTLVKQVIDTKTEELNCDEMMRVMTAYAEKLSGGEAIEIADDESIEHHLDLCPECREEFEMIEGIAKEGGLSDKE